MDSADQGDPPNTKNREINTSLLLLNDQHTLIVFIFS